MHVILFTLKNSVQPLFGHVHGLDTLNEELETGNLAAALLVTSGICLLRHL